MGNFPQYDVLLYAVSVLSSSAVFFALGLDGVTSLDWGLVNYGARDVGTVVHWGQEKYFHFLAGVYLGQSLCIL